MKIGKEIVSQGVFYMSAGITPKPVYLKNVEVNTMYLKKDEESLQGEAREAAYKGTLKFTFATPTLAGEEANEKIFTKMEFQLKEGVSPKAVNILFARIKHVYEAFGVWPEMRECDDWKDLFTEVAKMFNEGNGGKPIYKDANGTPKPVWLHIVINDSKLPDFPDFPPFIEAAIKDKPTNLVIDNRKYIYKVPETVANVATGGGGPLANLNDLPGVSDAPKVPF